MLKFEFVVVFNLLILMLWPASTLFPERAGNARTIVWSILAFIAFILDIIFLFLALGG